MTRKKKMILGGIFGGIFALMLIGYFTLLPRGNGDEKQLTIVVVGATQEEKSYNTKTDAAFLQGAMDDTKEFSYSGSDTTMGFVLEEINGERAIYGQDRAYWGIFINEEYVLYGIAEQPVQDGDSIRFVYTLAQ